GKRRGGNQRGWVHQDQGLRHRAAGRGGRGHPGGGAAGALQVAPPAIPVPARDRVRDRAAEDCDRQDPALQVARKGSRPCLSTSRWCRATAPGKRLCRRRSRCCEPPAPTSSSRSSTSTPTPTCATECPSPSTTGGSWPPPTQSFSGPSEIRASRIRTTWPESCCA